MEKTLGPIFLAKANLKRKPVRTAALTVLVGLLSFTVFASLLIIESLKKGISGIQSRLGADLIIVPEEYENEAMNVLLSGEPNYFYLDKDIENLLAEIKGIQQITSQYYLTSLSESCCDFPVQIIGFDEKSDFVIKPWAGKKYTPNEQGEIILAGYSVPLEKKTFKLFGKSHTVCAKLSKSGSGLDSAIFVDSGTLQKIYKDATDRGFAFISDGNTDTKASTILCRLSDSVKSDTTSLLIRQKINGIKVIQKKSFLSHFEKSLSSLVIFLYSLSLIFLIATILILSVVFSLILNERLKEFAILRTLGGNHKFLSKIVLLEAFFIGLTGGFTGVLFSSIFFFPFSTLISQKISLPFILPEASLILIFAVLTILIAVFSSVIASLRTIYHISGFEPYGEVK